MSERTPRPLAWAITLIAVGAVLMGAGAAPAAAADQYVLGPPSTSTAGTTFSFTAINFDEPWAAVTGVTVQVSSVGTNGTTIAGDSIVTVRPRVDLGSGFISTVGVSLTPVETQEVIIAGMPQHLQRYDVSGLAGVQVRYQNVDTVNHTNVAGAVHVERNYEPAPDTSGPSEVSGTVALSASDRERLDLGWYGAWALVGLLLVAMIAPSLLSAMKVTRGM